MGWILSLARQYLWLSNKNILKFVDSSLNLVNQRHDLSKSFSILFNIVEFDILNTGDSLSLWWAMISDVSQTLTTQESLRLKPGSHVRHNRDLKDLSTLEILCVEIHILEYVFNWRECRGQTAANHKRISCWIDCHEFIPYTRMTIAMCDFVPCNWHLGVCVLNWREQQTADPTGLGQTSINTWNFGRWDSHLGVCVKLMIASGKTGANPKRMSCCKDCPGSISYTRVTITKYKITRVSGPLHLRCHLQRRHPVNKRILHAKKREWVIITLQSTLKSVVALHTMLPKPFSRLRKTSTRGVKKSCYLALNSTRNCGRFRRTGASWES